MNIIIIDDESVICDGLSHMISSINSDYHIIGIFTDASEALQTSDWDNVQLVITDISMPGMDGLEFLRLLKKINSSIIVVIITAYAKFEYAQEAIKYQVLDYLLKPVNKKQLTDILKKTDCEYQKRNMQEQDASYLALHIEQLRKYFFMSRIFDENYMAPDILNETLIRYKLIDKFVDLYVVKTSQQKPELQKALSNLEDTNLHFYLYGADSVYTILALYNQESSNSTLPVLNFKGTFVFSKHLSVSDNLSDAYLSLLSNLNTKLKKENSLYNGKSLPIITDPAAGKTFSPNVANIVKYIRKNYSKHLSLTQISEEIYLHPNYLSNIFKKEVGITLTDYLNVYRIMSAEKLLLDPKNKIYWVTEQVGFVNQRYFGEVFKKVTGMTPTQFRQATFLPNQQN